MKSSRTRTFAILAGLVLWIASRRPMLRAFVWISLIVYPLAFLGPALDDADVFKYVVLVVTLWGFRSSSSSRS